MLTSRCVAAAVKRQRRGVCVLSAAKKTEEAGRLTVCVCVCVCEYMCLRVCTCSLSPNRLHEQLRVDRIIITLTVTITTTVTHPLCRSSLRAPG
jgi:hypothetical protein